MKKVILMAAFFAAFASCGSTKVDPTPKPGPGPEPTPGPDTPTFYKGADISWASEMEAGGIKFKKKDGTEAPLLEVLKSCGINAIRLRVWVKPYGGWSGKADVVNVAKKVQA
ncbi:MAG: glycosyl hydrolase 53 family protein, partial [Bacteroidales bacterium]|nr:glycosyl hydrolase 53 family protein [Bacteroidales bacterium]